MSLSSASWPRLSGERCLSIDVLRALTIVAMLLVNQWHGVSGVPQWLRHYPADADAMSVADIVFPSFLFIVGMSIPPALQARLSRGLGAVLGNVALRWLGLLVLGVLMVSTESGSFAAAAMPLSIQAWAALSCLGFFLVWGSLSGGAALAWPWRAAGVALLIGLAWVWRGGADGGARIAPQWWGILGLIGWAYGIACLAYLALRGRLVLLLLAMGVVLAWRMLLPGWGDGHAAHALIVLAGAVTMLLFYDQGLSLSLARRRALALGFALVMALLATGLRPAYPISKIYASPSWILYCSALSVLAFYGLHAWLDVARRGMPGWRWLAPVAAHPLLTYLLPFAIAALLPLLGLAWPPQALQHGLVGVLAGCVFLLFVLWLVRVLGARGVRLRV